MMCADAVRGTVTSWCRGRFSFPGRGRARGRLRIAKKPQGHTSALRLKGCGGGRGNLARSHFTTYSWEVNISRSQLEHQSSKPHLTWAATGRQWQLVHIFVAVTAGSEAAGSAAANWDAYKVASQVEHQSSKPHNPVAAATGRQRQFRHKEAVAEGSAMMNSADVPFASQLFNTFSLGRVRAPDGPADAKRPPALDARGNCQPGAAVLLPQTSSVADCRALPYMAAHHHTASAITSCT